MFWLLSLSWIPSGPCKLAQITCSGCFPCPGPLLGLANWLKPRVLAAFPVLDSSWALQISSNHVFWLLSPSWTPSGPCKLTQNTCSGCFPCPGHLSLHLPWLLCQHDASPKLCLKRHEAADPRTANPPCCWGLPAPVAGQGGSDCCSASLHVHWTADERCRRCISAGPI